MVGTRNSGSLVYRLDPNLLPRRTRRLLCGVGRARLRNRRDTLRLHAVSARQPQLDSRSFAVGSSDLWSFATRFARRLLLLRALSGRRLLACLHQLLYDRFHLQQAFHIHKATRACAGSLRMPPARSLAPPLFSASPRPSTPSSTQRSLHPETSNQPRPKSTVRARSGHFRAFCVSCFRSVLISSEGAATAG